MASEGTPEHEQGSGQRTSSGAAQPVKDATLSMKEFLETRAPGVNEEVTGKAVKVSTTSGIKIRPEFPVLTLHCPNPQCGTPRPFDCLENDPYLAEGRPTDLFIPYRCRTCQDAEKTYAIRCTALSTSRFLMFKFGEDFPFGEPVPRAVLDILGDEKPVFLKGRTAEKRGLGLGAFAYYRRVVESQSKQIFGAIVRAAEALGADKEALAELTAASNERQFSKAVESLKHGIPDALRVAGHDPLTLLHDALSEGLHAQTDQDCLELAKTVRVVLTALVQRIGEVTRQENDLKVAVAQLLEKQRDRKARAPDPRS